MNVLKQISSVSFFIPFVVSAQTLGNPTPGGGASLQDFVNLLIEIVQMIGIPMLVVAIIYAGFLLVTAGDNEKQRTTGKMWVLWVVVGAAIVLGARVLSDLVYNTAGAF